MYRKAVLQLAVKREGHYEAVAPSEHREANSAGTEHIWKEACMAIPLGCSKITLKASDLYKKHVSCKYLSCGRLLLELYDMWQWGHFDVINSAIVEQVDLCV